MKPEAQHRGHMNFNKNIGMLVLAIFLILYGIVTAFTVAIPTIVLGILALIAGILILIGR
ncbi:MAG: hypothetical protein M3Z64_10790 [Verrucomicrobiota bacterium]|nr:hypothetical protein [Verrucomicrobiota bacterium]